MTYSTGPFTGTVQLRYIGPGKFETVDATSGQVILGPGDPGYSTTYIGSINNNKVDSAVYVNLSASYDIGSHYAVFGTVNNLFDKDPAVAPGGNGYPTNPVYFDTYGRTWKLGMRVRLLGGPHLHDWRAGARRPGFSFCAARHGLALGTPSAVNELALGQASARGPA